MISVIREISSQWRGSALLRLGVFVIALLLLLFAVDNLTALRSEKINDLQNHRLQNMRKKEIAKDSTLPERSKKLAEQRAAQEKRFFRAETTGLAQANIRTRLLTLLKTHSLPQGHLKIEPAVPVEALAGCYSITVNYYAVMQRSELFRLLEMLEKEPLLIVIDRFVFRENAEKNASLVCHFFCMIDK